MKILVVGLALALALPCSAEACSCPAMTRELVQQLVDAKAHSPHIYFARVERLQRSEGRSFEDQAQFTLLEVFRGSLKPGQQLLVPASGSGDCTFRFEIGDEVLVYSVNDDPTSVLMCTRTHVVHAGDSELTWLRTGISPPVPVAVRVQQAQCSECKITSFGVPSREVFKANEVLAALSDGGAFWTGEYPVSMLVHTAAGELFELSPRPMTRERCVQRIIRRTCSTLVSAGAHRVGEPELVCADAGAETIVCDETHNRNVNWGPLLEVSSLARSRHPLSHSRQGSPPILCSSVRSIGMCLSGMRAGWRLHRGCEHNWGEK